MPSGGYRKPEKPAPVSGPGAYSKRTDGGPTQAGREMTGGEYGESKDMRDLQGSAPLAASARPPQGTIPVESPGQNVVPFGSPSGRPNEPLTTGNPMGQGGGPELLGLNQEERDSPDRQRLRNWLPMLEAMAATEGASDTLRAFVRKVQGVAK